MTTFQNTKFSNSHIVCITIRDLETCWLAFMVYDSVYEIADDEKRSADGGHCVLRW